MSMQANKRESQWISVPVTQGGTESDWIEQQPIIEGSLGAVTKRTGTSATELVCWDDALSDGERFVIRQDAAVYEGLVNKTSTYPVEINRIDKFDKNLIQEKSIDVSSHVSGSVYDMFISPDGTKLYIGTISTGEDIYQFTLTTPWDITTISYDNKTAGNSGVSFEFDPTGTILWAGEGTNPDGIRQFSLSTPWDLSTLSGTFDYFSVDGNTPIEAMDDFTIGDDGTKLYVFGYPDDTMHQFTLTTPWDVTTASATGKTLDFYATTGLSRSYNSIWMSNDGVYVYLANYNEYIDKYELSVPWDITTASFLAMNNSRDNTNQNRATVLKPDQSVLYSTSTAAVIRQYAVSTSDDVTYKDESTIDLTDFGLAASPQYVFTQVPDMRVCLEDTGPRCISRNTPMNIYAVGTDQIQVTYSDTLNQVLEAGDLVVVDEGDVAVTSVVDTGTVDGGGDKIWNVNLPLTTIPTYAYIKDRSELMPYTRTPIAGTVYQYAVSLSTAGSLNHTFDSQAFETTPRRAIQLSAIAGTDTTVTTLRANLWKAGEPTL